MLPTLRYRGIQQGVGRQEVPSEDAGLIIRYRGCNGCLEQFAVMPFRNGLPVRGLWSLIPVLVAFPLILSQQPSCD